MSKKKNISAKQDTLQIPETPAAATLAKYDANEFQHVVIIGVRADDSLLVNTSFNTFESIHAAILRAQLEVVINHNRVVNEALKAKQDENGVTNDV